jgi:hypothetical protein
MNVIGRLLLIVLCGSGLAAGAQTPPKLALAGVGVNAAFTNNPDAGSLTADNLRTPEAHVDVLGVWDGVASLRNLHFTVTITKSADDSLNALVERQDGGSWQCTSVVNRGNFLKLQFFDDQTQKPTTLTGDVDVASGIWQVDWNGVTPPFTVTFHHTTVFPDHIANQAVQEPKVPVISLEELVHDINVQLFDHFKGEQLFNVLSDADLAQAIPATGQPPNPPYDFSSPATADKFNQAGISYVLCTTVEDYSDQTLEMRRTQSYHYQTGVSYGRYDTGLYNGGGVQTQGGFDPLVWQRQIMRLTVRCQLYDAATGALRKSTNYTIPAQRDYVAVAQGKNELSTVDMYQAAASKVAELATVLVDNAVFPIRVLVKNDQEITISRGSEAGLRVGQVFLVNIEGPEIKDPDTGKVLGRDIKRVGRVAITELEPKFSHASIMEDSGIVMGATLVPAQE